MPTSFDLFTVRWPHRVYSDRFHRILTLRRRTDRSPVPKCIGSDPDMPSQSFLPTTSVSFIVVYYSASKSSRYILLTFLIRPPQIGDRSRAPGGVSMDGRVSHILNPGESVTVEASPYPVPCINRSSITESGDEPYGHGEGAPPGKEDDWVRDINNLLQYNATFRSKALLRYSRT
jgi:hypothetical protein